MVKKIHLDSLIFDVDGVLLNVEKSFPEVIRQGVLRGWTRFCGGERDCEGYGPGHEWVMKRHGAFNDDFDLTWALLSICAAAGPKKLSQAFPSPEKLAAEVATLRGDDVAAWVLSRYGDRVPRGAVRQMCAGLYQGTDAEEGLFRLEIPMLRCSWRDLPLPVGIYSGRCMAEWNLAKKSLGWEDFPTERVIHSDTGIMKPSPRGLEILCERMGVELPLFFGDTASDMRAQAAFGRGQFVAVGGLLPEAPMVFKDTESALEGLLNFKTEQAGM